jgi:hypothetical protein
MFSGRLSGAVKAVAIDRKTTEKLALMCSELGAFGKLKGQITQSNFSSKADRHQRNFIM